MADPVIKTIKPSGGDYTSLTNWESGRQADLTSAAPEWAEQYAGTTETALTINGWTTTATNGIKIYAAASDRHTGVWDDNKAKLSKANVATITNYEDFVAFDGLQIAVTSVNGGSEDCITSAGATYASGATLVISNCLIKGATSGTYNQIGINIPTTAINLVVKLFNDVVYGIGTAANSRAVTLASGQASSIYNCTLIGGQYAIRTTGTITAKNVYAGGSSSGDFSAASGSLNLTTCASSDTTAAGTALDSIAINTTNFTNVTAGSEDFRLPGIGSALYHVGTDTSGDSAPLNFTIDINGDTYYSTRSIGADEYVAAGGSMIPMAMASYRRRRY